MDFNRRGRAGMGVQKTSPTQAGFPEGALEISLSLLLLEITRELGPLRSMEVFPPHSRVLSTQLTAIQRPGRDTLLE